MEIDRRELLRRLGLSSLALASLPALADAIATSASAQTRATQVSFHFTGISGAGPRGTSAAPRNQIIMGGDGRFAPRAGGEATGGGVYAHYLFPGRNPNPGEPPLPLVGSGTWAAKTVVSYSQTGVWAFDAAGILEIVIDLFQELPAKRVIRNARLKLVSNVASAALTTGQTEGYTLSIPGTELATGATPGPLGHLDPPVGIAAFSTVPIF